jgi:hypothetical protein
MKQRMQRGNCIWRRDLKVLKIKTSCKLKNGSGILRSLVKLQVAFKLLPTTTKLIGTILIMMKA